MRRREIEQGGDNKADQQNQHSDSDNADFERNLFPKGLYRGKNFREEGSCRRGLSGIVRISRVRRIFGIALISLERSILGIALISLERRILGIPLISLERRILGIALISLERRILGIALISREGCILGMIRWLRKRQHKAAVNTELCAFRIFGLASGTFHFSSPCNSEIVN